MNSKDSMYLKSSSAPEMSNEDLLAHALLNLGSIGLGAAFGGAQGGELGANVGSKITKDVLEQQRASRALEKELASKAQEKSSEREFQKELAMLKLDKEKTKAISSGDAERLAAHDSALSQLSDLSKTVAANEDIVGPVAGRVATLNPYNVRSKTLDASLKIAAQNIGKSLEGGKLTDADIERYRQMLPSVTDTPAVAQEKIATVSRLVQQRREAELKNLGQAGADVSRFAAIEPIKTKIMEPKEAAMNKVVTDLFGGTPAMATQPHPKDQQAIEWAKKNSTDPRAIAILKRFGAGG